MTNPFQTMYQLAKKPQGMVVYGLVMILAYYFIDKPIALFCHGMDWGHNFPALHLLTLLGQNKLYVLIILPLGLYFQWIAKQRTHASRCWFILIYLLIAILFNYVLKISFGRARPDLLFAYDYYGFYWFKFINAYWSFPSGHTTTAVAIAWALSTLFPKYAYGFLSLVIVVMLSRILLCNHYLTDVMAAFYITILVMGLLTEYLKGKGFKIGLDP